MKCLYLFLIVGPPIFSYPQNVSNERVNFFSKEVERCLSNSCEIDMSFFIIGPELWSDIKDITSVKKAKIIQVTLKTPIFSDGVAKDTLINYGGVVQRLDELNAIKQYLKDNLEPTFNMKLRGATNEEITYFYENTPFNTKDNLFVLSQNNKVSYALLFQENKLVWLERI